MSNSHEQSLDENVVFLPVNESSPEFLHCEKERQAVERLLNAGPEAFYSSIGTERSGCFLSSEEVSQISSWAQDYRLHPLQVQRQENGEDCSSEMEDFCSTYFPSFTDTPPPSLELGWPEKSPWGAKDSVRVHTSPPAEGDPSVRQIIRWHLQNAGEVIAIVTDRLTDGAIIGDLHKAASRGVPVYIILNQRSIQENFTLNRLRHPNMQVRVLGGKTFCSRTGRMVVGEMKDNFLLFDLQTVIHGSYSLTWTDAHLHRQLITVLNGPVVESFDREFRTLFAASLPVPDTWREAETHVDVTHHLKDRSDLGFQRHHLYEPEIANPPSPPADSLLDWVAMGVIHTTKCSPLDQHDEIMAKEMQVQSKFLFDQQEEIMAKEMQMQSQMLFDKNTLFMDSFRPTYNGNQFVDNKRVYRNTSPVTNNVPHKLPTFNRVDHIINKAIARQLSAEKSTNLDDRTRTRLDDEGTEPTHNINILPFSERRETLKREAILGEVGSINKTSSPVENKPSSRKPLILMVPQSESYKSLSDIMKRTHPQQSPSGQIGKGSKAAASELTQTMMELSVNKTQNRGVPVPRFMASCFDPDQMTPALNLMRKRNDELKPLLYRSQQNLLPRERPRSSSYASWRWPLAEAEGKQE
ncbi:protein FAM83D isoform X1 [Trematomus bernacchii]|uniref:protein FAM83D isoform X1 n=1 Tax=Trematomus bernacchii TaxID=40690 RepID=UPI00146F2841|nr:protein FAM83D isoform X1 [Trematomus bernacchii]